MADLNLADLIEEETELPKLTRGRSSEDYDTLIDLMRNGKPHSIPNVTEEDRAKLGQKVRGAAAKAGFKVTVRYSKSQEKLYFQRTDKVEDSATDSTSDNGTDAAKAKGSTKKS